MPEKQDIYTRVTDQIVRAMESGADRWEMPWHKAKLTIPLNPTTGNEYRGSNIISLWADAEERGYDNHMWATYKQWGEKEAQVRKGEKAYFVVFWKFLDKKAGPEEEDHDDHRIALARAYPVFNVAQVDGYPLPSPGERKPP